MRIISTMILLSAIACDRQSDTSFREGSSGAASSSSGGDACEPPPAAPMGSVTETWACACETSEDCKPGLRCVPLPETKVSRCFAPVNGETPEGGGYITSCKYGLEDRALFYPAGINDSELFCSACVSCAPPIEGSLVCQ